MKMKLFAAVFLVLFFASLMFWQLNVVKAQAAENNEGPVTRPLTHFQQFITGMVYYIYNGAYYGARNVKITAKNRKTSRTVHITTNYNGQYWLNVKPGIYLVQPGDKTKTHFSPSFKVVNATKAGVYGVNFYGTLHHAPTKN